MARTECGTATANKRDEQPGAGDDHSDGATATHECSRFTGADHAAIAQHLDALREQEAAWANDVLRYETASVPELWRVLRLSGLASHWCV